MNHLKNKKQEGRERTHESDRERNGTWGGRGSQQRPRWLPGTGASQELTPCQPTVSSQAGNLRWTGQPGSAETREGSPAPAPDSTLTSWELSELLIWSSISGTTCKGPLREDRDCLQGRGVRQ